MNITIPDNIKGKRVYLAGPMRGIPNFNFPAFHEAARLLRESGCEVFNPAEHDEKKHGKEVSASATGNLDDIKSSGFNLNDALKSDLTWICDKAEAIALLPGWTKSKGATAERATGLALGYIVVELSPSLTTGEVILTDASTGGQKGQKLERFDLIPGVPMLELARVYGRGAVKYSADNWRLGYAWSLSFAALSRHAWSFWLGEQRDEDGNHHLAQVAWHCMTLMEFERTHPKKDNRPIHV